MPIHVHSVGEYAHQKCNEMHKIHAERYLCKWTPYPIAQYDVHRIVFAAKHCRECHQHHTKQETYSIESIVKCLSSCAPNYISSLIRYDDPHYSADETNPEHIKYNSNGDTIHDLIDKFNNCLIFSLPLVVKHTTPETHHVS